MQQSITIDQIFRDYGQLYIANNPTTEQQRSIIHLLGACRTPALGGHYLACDQCSCSSTVPNACRNRHCPVCQHKDQLQWLDSRMKELLPIGYYHMVFTLPHELNPICLQNKKLMYGLFFKAASQTLAELTRDIKYLGANSGSVMVLHTWGQAMTDHIHLHCVMPAGGISFDDQHWVHPKKKGDFLIPGKVMAEKFRGKFLDFFSQAFANNQLEFHGKLIGFKSKKTFNALLSKLYKKNWVVNIEKPLGSPQKVLEYLSRYVFRVAITDKRIIGIENNKVIFRWKNYRKLSFETMRLDVDEFIRRFLLHILPKGFLKVRYYGIMASRNRKKNIVTAREILHQEQLNQLEEDQQDGIASPKEELPHWDKLLKSIEKVKKPNCPVCHKGFMRFAGMVPKNLTFEAG